MHSARCSHTLAAVTGSLATKLAHSRAAVTAPGWCLMTVARAVAMPLHRHEACTLAHMLHEADLRAPAVDFEDVLGASVA